MQNHNRANAAYFSAILGVVIIIMISNEKPSPAAIPVRAFQTKDFERCRGSDPVYMTNFRP